MFFKLGCSYNKDVTSVEINSSEKLKLQIGNIGRFSYINGVVVHTNSGDEVINIQVGNYCSIADGTQLFCNRDHDMYAVSTSAYLPVRPDMKHKGQIIIGHDVWIGNNASIMAGATIGHGSVIGAGAIVKKTVPPFAVVAGNPSRIIKYRFNEEQIKSLLETEWWYWPSEKVEETKDDFALGVDGFLEKHASTLAEVKPFAIDGAKTKILFYPDFDSRYPIWISVIEEYLSKFSDKDNVLLVLRIPQDESYENSLNILQVSLPRDMANMADIFVVNDEIDNEESLFGSVDYFIADRSKDVIRYIDYANRANVKVIAGVDRPIFDSIVI